MTEQIFILRMKMFGWRIRVDIDFSCMFEFFIIHLKGFGTRSYLTQASIFDIKVKKSEPDAMVEGIENGYKTFSRNPKYANDKFAGWNWCLKEGKKNIFNE